MNFTDYIVQIEISNGRNKSTREIFVSAICEGSAVKQAFKAVLDELEGNVVYLKKKCVWRAVETVRLCNFKYNWFC